MLFPDFLRVNLKSHQGEAVNIGDGPFLQVRGVLAVVLGEYLCVQLRIGFFMGSEEVYIFCKFFSTVLQSKVWVGGLYIGVYSVQSFADVKPKLAGAGLEHGGNK